MAKNGIRSKKFFHEIDLFDFMRFFALDFFNFLAHCVFIGSAVCLHFLTGFSSKFYSAYTPVLQRAVEIWYQDPQVTTPVLKLFAELVQNRSQRLQFDVSSPNGILLFREASKIICTYGKFFSHSLSLKSKKKCNFENSQPLRT